MSVESRAAAPVHVCPSGIQRPPVDPGHFDAWRKLPPENAEALVDVMYRLDDVAERDGGSAYDARFDLHESRDAIMEALEGHPSARGVSTNRRWFGPVAMELAIERRGRCPHCYRHTGQLSLALDPNAPQDDPPPPRPSLPAAVAPIVLPSPAPRPTEKPAPRPAAPPPPPLPTQAAAEMARLALAALKAKKR